MDYSTNKPWSKCLVSYILAQADPRPDKGYNKLMAM